MFNIDIDTGGTMTDGLVSGDGSVVALKAETTPHDVTIAFVDIVGRENLFYLGLAGMGSAGTGRNGQPAPRAGWIIRGKHRLRFLTGRLVR